MTDLQGAVVVEVDSDICDECTHKAKVAAFLYARNPAWPASLAFCAHHGTENYAALIRQGATVVDMRHLVSA